MDQKEKEILDVFFSGLSYIGYSCYNRVIIDNTNLDTWNIIILKFILEFI